MMRVYNYDNRTEEERSFLILQAEQIEAGIDHHPDWHKGQQISLVYGDSTGPLGVYEPCTPRQAVEILMSTAAGLTGQRLELAIKWVGAARQAAGLALRFKDGECHEFRIFQARGETFLIQSSTGDEIWL